MEAEGDDVALAQSGDAGAFVGDQAAEDLTQEGLVPATSTICVCLSWTVAGGDPPDRKLFRRATRTELGPGEVSV